MPPAGLSSLGRVRPAAALFVLALFAAACSSDKQAAPTTTEAPPAALKPSPAPAPPPKRSKVHVIVFDGDVAFVANYHASVRAYSMRNGKRAWRRDLGGIMASSPAVHDEDLIVHAMNGHVYVLDRHNGKIRWSYTTGAPIESSPLVL